MNSIRSIQKLNKRELEEGITPEGSWHTDYRDTAFINVGGLPFELSEGDIITIFSQYGEPVWIKLARDKDTGKSRGFAWIKYEDQRSCDLAVDNMGGATFMDRVLRVDHARYKARDDEDMRDNTMGDADEGAAGEQGGGRRKRQRTQSRSDSDEDRLLLPEEIELEKAIQNLDEEDPMKASLVMRLQEKADNAVKKYKKSKRKEKERSRIHERRQKRDRSRDHDRVKSEHKERRRIKEREESVDEDRQRSFRRRRDPSEDSNRDHRRDRDRRDKRDRSRERRHHSSDEEDHQKPRSKRSPSPRRKDHGRRDDSSRGRD